MLIRQGPRCNDPATLPPMNTRRSRCLRQLRLSRLQGMSSCPACRRLDRGKCTARLRYRPIQCRLTGWSSHPAYTCCCRLRWLPFRRMLRSLPPRCNRSATVIIAVGIHKADLTALTSAGVAAAEHQKSAVRTATPQNDVWLHDDSGCQVERSWTK